MDPRNPSRSDSLEDLSMLLTVIQRMGRTLANSSTATSYRSVREFNELVHQARMKVEAMRATTPARSEAAPPRHKPRVI